jgi:hypothetical protein
MDAKEFTLKRPAKEVVWACIANCPLCGADLTTVELVRTCGHVRADDSATARFVLFSTCREHYDKAARLLSRDPSHERSGYMGEWEPRFGMVRAKPVTESIPASPAASDKE